MSYGLYPHPIHAKVLAQGCKGMY